MCSHLAKSKEEYRKVKEVLVIWEINQELCHKKAEMIKQATEKRTNDLVQCTKYVQIDDEL